MTAKVQMVAPHLTVLLEDGAVHEIQADNRDMVAYDRTARKRGWPGPQEAQIEWCTFLAWNGLRREGLISASVTFDEFVDICVNIDPRPVTADPTLPDPVDG